ncbi:MAG TPA: hypothetical protein VEF04_22185, partial [Blastocatellia bacterium]|nr:hypothetical protein [Blastocatellia bacterium]
ILRMILVVLGILMIPFIASFLTDEMQWSVSDFIFMGVLLLAAGTIYEIGVKVSSSTPARIGFGVAVFTGFVLIWMNLAVGIIGSEDNPANVLFAAVIAVAFFGAIIAKFEAPGMAKALTVTAVAQFLVPIIAIVMFRPDFSPGVAKVFVLNLFFVGLWLTSATFFRKAAELGPPSAPGRA